MTSPPLDQAVRDAAVELLDQTLFVEAGAGTGKTTMLVSRVVALVTSGEARMDEIAAITFTEAAAAELRDRLAKEFEELAADDSNTAARAAADALDASSVTTLHGFARKILAELPFAVGLPPLFDVTDASSSRVAFDERWERFVDGLLEHPDHEELVTRALSCGMSWDALRTVARRAEDNWDRLVQRPGGAPPPPINPARLITLLDRSLQLGSVCRALEDRLAARLRTEIAPGLQLLRDAADEIDGLQIMVGLGKIKASNVGQKGNWTVDGVSHKDEVLAVLGEAEVERVRLLDETLQWVLSELFTQVTEFTLQAAAERRAAGHLSFHDLLVLARELVCRHADARAELHRRYRFILIDEFQDTDPLQAELALSLASDAGVDGGQDWASLPVPPGRLFFVGDPKQSIYRFRRADIDVFMQTRNRVVGSALQLTTNFRSRPAIVAWVNAVFDGLFGVGDAGKQPPYQPLDAHDDRGQDNGRGLAPVIVVGRTPVPGLAEQVRTQQAADVVAAIATLHDEGWKLGTSGQALRYADVAVLMPTRNGLPSLEEAFRAAGVPYRLESSSLVYQSQEVQHLLAILRAIADPTDAVSLLGAVRSPAFGCADDDLFRHRASGGDWSQPRVEDGGPVDQALAEIRRYHESGWWESVSALVGQVVAERRLMALALTDARPRESWRRLRFLVDQARLFDESNGGDLRGFLRWVGHQQEEGAQVTEAILPESDDDAVRVTTIHAAKGLEYPVVVLVGLQTKPNNQREALLFTDDGPQVCLQASFQMPGYGAALEFEKEMAAYERIRLLYVAATRATDVLIVSAHREERKEDTSLLARVMAQCDAYPELWSDGTELTVRQPERRERSTADAVDEGSDDREQRRQFFAQRELQLVRATTPRTIAATGVQRLAEHERAATLDDGAAIDIDAMDQVDGASVHRRGRAGTAVGRAVHAVLQVIDLATGAELERMAHAQAVAEGVDDRAPEVADRVRSALASGLVTQAVRSGRYWREVYVGVPVGQRVLEGFIDLLFETPEGLAIVDYKTDRVPEGATAGDVARRYRLQGASYALALTTALGKPVASCSFLILDRASARAEPLDDLSGAMAEVAELLSHPLS